MKLTINKSSFLKSWSLAEKNVASPGGMNVLCSVRMTANAEGVCLFATDARTSIICRVTGVTVLEPGEVIFPVKGVGDLFRKAATSEFTLHVEGERATLIAGKSRSRFSTFPAVDFPDFDSSASANVFCKVEASELLSLIEKGTLAASTTEDFPQYLSSVLFEGGANQLKVVATDNRRLSYAAGISEITEGVPQLLLPIGGVKDLTRILAALPQEAQVNILYDHSQVYFVSEIAEFAVRRVESKFPMYERIIPRAFTTELLVDRSVLMAALDRLDIVVRDYNRTVILTIKEGVECLLTAWAPEFGQAVEEIPCTVTGESMMIGVNSRFFMDGMKNMSDDTVKISFNGSEGHVAVSRVGGDDYLCLLAPVELEKEALEIQGDAF